ncbi:hypothetical protein [Uliginosibacterium sp. TH139]|uniref:hypothetical protein n=1 Tax=Uliginosibacterium sp. TH139 TaxID=2067453 RepID=UPI00117D0333|nr:hypothetical protein [Uliginosibacterium sp. TH139]
MPFNLILVLLFAASGVACTAEPPEKIQKNDIAASGMTLPNENEATASIIKMMDLADTLAQMQVSASVKLGTCIPAIDANHPGQVACTIAVRLGASTSETQADFYRKGAGWVSQPSTSQDKLPFPDPAL